ncbi:spermidine synthase [Cellulomonas triticagri]|uniref:spermidine synthase n=1 Tax=Cellulomonas triticagri TaxID=2483352 RepID=UPI0018F50F99|nr:fused MFS/spermidine synthase [Cellulomonas triticagri]
MPITTGTAEVQRSPDDPDAVTLLVNGVPSSHLDLSDPERLDFEYMQQMAAVLDHLPADGGLRAVHLGAAGCALARWVHARSAGSRQIAVDLDPELVRLVREWFDLPRSPALRLRAGEARAELATLPNGGADAVVRDVFAGDRTPEHLTTEEFVRDVARALRPGGVYLANCADRPPLGLARAEAATAGAVFAHVGVVAEPSVLRGRRYGNVVVIGTDDPDLLADSALARDLRSLPVPARLLTADELAAFVGRTPPLRDAAPETGPDPEVDE